MFFFERNSSFPQYINSKSDTVKHGGFDSCFSTSKTLIFIKLLLQNGDYVYKTDLKDAYFSVPLSKESRKLVRF